MDENLPAQFKDDITVLKSYWTVLRSNLWNITLISISVGFATLLLTFLRPNIYKATAVISPSNEEKRQNSTLGALASFGVNIGGPSNVEDLDSLFKSNDLVVRVFRKYNLWPIVLGDRFDAMTGKIKPELLGRLFGNEKGPRLPGDWDAIRAAKDRLTVSVNRKAGTITVSFESPSAEGSANIVKYYLEEGKSRLQEEALDRAVKNKKFIEEQIKQTIDALILGRLYTLLGQEVEREMMARNREQYGFRVIDSPRIPDRKAGPARASATALAMLMAAIASYCYFLFRRGV
ncbi:MAG: hypothetical protein IH628_00830 [Proteobacteria bacterium]|nr:hypothetical protein [Pseudomonadota bacterium]